LPTYCTQPERCLASVGFGTRLRTQRTSAPRPSPPWLRFRQCANTCTCRFSRVVTYLEKLDAAKAGIDDLAVTTDIIVGFPGETDTDFDRTLEVVAEAQYDSAYTFIFSPRPGTEAADMTEQFVDADVVKERFERLRVVVERSGRAKHQARIGRIEEVVVEGPSKRDPAMLTGRTRQNKLLHFKSEPIKVGTYVNVEVTEAFAHSLRGELREIVAPALHKTRIPVAVI